MKSLAAIGSLSLLAFAAVACGEKEPARDPSMSSSSSSTTQSTSGDSESKRSALPPTTNTTPTNNDNTTSGSAAQRGDSQRGEYPRTTQPLTGSGGGGGGGGAGNTTSSSNTPPPAPAAAAPAATPDPATTTKPDNTKNNERDRKTGTLTPVDQGNSGPELKITATIRKALVGSKMSFNAKNAKVITTGTKVTLRGPVASDTEKAEIEKIAKGAEGVTEVDNQLEVKK